MKRVVIAMAVCAAIGLGLWLSRSPNAPISSPSTKVQQQHPGTLAVIADGPAIFKKVLWRAPSPDDKILNAERREWRDGADLSHWQWFLHVDASKDLLEYLQVTNAFGLQPGTATQFENAPHWFPSNADAFDVQRSGAMTFLFERGSNVFYATSRGKGFTKSLPVQIATPATGPQPQSRVPSTPPPNPKD